jgi:ATP-dependent RNA helicase RhlE
MQQTTSRPTRGRNRRRPHGGRSNARPGQRAFRGGRSGGRRGRKRELPTFDPTQFINKNPVAVKEEVYKPEHRFSDFAIDRRLVKTVAAMGISAPSPIQDQVIPHILEYKDVVGLAETGTGKTAAFLIPLIELKKQDTRSITLILTPTRELAIQVQAELDKLAKNFRFFSTVCVGGVGIGGQIRQLRRPNQFVIGTPGRIKDLLDRGIFKANLVNSVVLDEADRMLDMGFIHDMKEILGQLPPQRQTLFFSATMDEKTKALVHDFMEDPVTISVKKKEVTDSIAQDVVPFVHTHKLETLLDLLVQDEFRRVIIFGAMKHSVERLGRELSRNGIKAESIHGNKNHSQRQRSLNRFKSGQVKVLVATDVAARGIHVDNISHVINYDLPNTFEDYVHRIGRTGRGKEKGQALTFIPQPAQ